MILLDRIRSRLDHKLMLNILLFSGLLTLKEADAVNVPRVPSVSV